jgi:nitroreductase
MSILTERRSIRKYDPTIKISKDEMIQILKLATRAPSSTNMQPWRFFIVESLAAKDKLKTVLYGNLTQLETSSAMICVFADLKKHLLAEKILNQAYEANLMDLETKTRRLNHMMNNVGSQPLDFIEKWGLVDGGLVSLQLMLAAKEFGYDTCPIGGFNRDKLAEALEIDSERYKPVMIISIGKRAEEGSRTLRLDPTDVATWL